MKDIGKKLQAFFKRKGYTVYEVSEMSGVPRSTINSWIAGHEPRIGALLKVCNAVGLDICELIKGDGQEKTIADRYQDMIEHFTN